MSLAPVSSRKQQVSSFISETTSLGNPSLPLRACIAYEAAGLSSPIEYPVVGLLSQPCSRGTSCDSSTGLTFLEQKDELSSMS
ncbi:hypothetical protein Bca52824_074196 [Brassica carinata]|uniref:Uncharacterized protein n=1 Tax=Brassica carinata TaxID=52824 RepID=A0A8X7QD21_BRACI|nr:hypothetical protein Bca52824_074196 [Brassica carinata]